jgi:hypothetical protein
MFYSVLLTMAADATLFELGVRQLTARIPFEGVTKRDAVRNLDTDEICRREAANLYKSGEPFLYREPHRLKNRNNTTFDFKNLKVLAYLRLDRIYHLKGLSQKLFS